MEFLLIPFSNGDWCRLCRFLVSRRLYREGGVSSGLRVHALGTPSLPTGNNGLFKGCNRLLLGNSALLTDHSTTGMGMAREMRAEVHSSSP